MMPCLQTKLVQKICKSKMNFRLLSLRCYLFDVYRKENVGNAKELANINNLIEKLEVEIQKETENASDQEKLWRFIDKKKKYYEKVHLIFYIQTCNRQLISF